MSDLKNELVWPYAIARAKVGREIFEELTDRLDAAIGSDFSAWQENEAQVAQKFSKLVEGINRPRDVATFILDNLLPLYTSTKASKGRRINQEFLNLIKELEPVQFIALVILYALRIGDQDGVSRAFDIYTSPTSLYLQHLEAYRDRHKGGLQRAAKSRRRFAERDQKILDKAEELHAKGIPKNHIASRLANEFDLTSTRIRQILRKTKMR